MKRKATFHASGSGIVCTFSFSPVPLLISHWAFFLFCQFVLCWEQCHQPSSSSHWVPPRLESSVICREARLLHDFSWRKHNKNRGWGVYFPGALVYSSHNCESRHTTQVPLLLRSEYKYCCICRQGSDSLFVLTEYKVGYTLPLLYAHCFSILCIPSLNIPFYFGTLCISPSPPTPRVPISFNPWGGHSHLLSPASCLFVLKH